MPARPRILLIDDSALVLAATRFALEAEGYEVDVALDLDSFEEHRAEHPPDLIMVDVQMPEAFGDDLAAMLRGAYHVECPILLLSTLPLEELEARARAAGVWGYVSKGEGIPALLTRVKEALAPRAGRVRAEHTPAGTPVSGKRS